MKETAPAIEFVIGDEKRLADIIGKREVEPLLGSAMKLGLGKAALLDEDGVAVLVMTNETCCRNTELLCKHLDILVEGEPKGTLVLETAAPFTGFEEIAQLLHDALQLTVTNNLKRMLTTEVHTSVVQESYDQLVATNRQLVESERRYRELAFCLEKKVEERTAELKQAWNTALQHEKLAAVGKLAAGMAHEINTPLGFIRSNLNSFAKYHGRMSQLLTMLRLAVSSDQLTDETKTQVLRRWKDLKMDFLLADTGDLLKQSIDGVDRIAGIISELKGFAHLDGMDERPVNLRHELEQLLSGISSSFPPGTRLVRNIPPLPEIICHLPLMVQAFANIIDNAAKSKDRDLEISVSATAGNRQIKITISDNGCGIPDENRSRIFEPFFTTRPVGSGSGMGLTVAHQAIMAAGGTIEVNSAVGAGTTVTVILPEAAGSTHL